MKADEFPPLSEYVKKVLTDVFCTDMNDVPGNTVSHTTHVQLNNSSTNKMSGNKANGDYSDTTCDISSKNRDMVHSENENRNTMVKSFADTLKPNTNGCE